MLHVDYRAAKSLMDLRIEEALTGTKVSHLKRQAGVQPLSWLSQKGRRFLGHLGRFLVVAGKRLEEYGPPQSLPLEGQARGCT